MSQYGLHYILKNTGLKPCGQIPDVDTPQGTNSYDWRAGQSIAPLIIKDTSAQRPTTGNTARRSGASAA